MANYKFKEIETMELDSLIRRVARKYSMTYETCSSRFGYDDVVSSCWIAVVDKVNQVYQTNSDAESVFELVDRNLLARVCHTTIIDMVRKEIKRPTISLDLESLEYAGDRNVGSDNSSLGSINDRLSTKFDTGYEITLVKEILNLFEEGTRERKLVEMFIKIYCNIDEFEDQALLSDLEGKGDVYDKWIAKKLNYANASSSGYQKLKNRVQATIARNGYANGFTKALERLVNLGYDVSQQNA